MKYKLVLVEDDKFALNQMSTIIKWEDYGFTLEGTFYDGADVLSWLENNSVDVIITDIKMPVITGIDIACVCSEKYPETSIVFMSAYKNFDYAKAGFAYGVTDYILKPLNRKQIIEVLNKCRNKLDALKDNKKTPNAGNKFSYKELRVVYMDFLKGTFKNAEEFKNALEEASKDVEFQKDFSILILRFEDYHKYVSERWKYSLERLKYAISNVAYSVNTQYKFIFIGRDGCELKFFGHNERMYDVKKSLEDACEGLKESLLQELNIYTEYVKIDKYSNLYELFDSFWKQKFELINRSDEIVRATIKFIEENYKYDISTIDAARNVSVDLAYFCRRYKKLTNETFSETLNKYRIEVAKQLIKDGGLDKISVLYTEVGYGTKTHFYKMFSKYTGLSPSQYKECLDNQL